MYFTFTVQAAGKYWTDITIGHSLVQNQTLHLISGNNFAQRRRFKVEFSTAC